MKLGYGGAPGTAFTIEVEGETFEILSAAMVDGGGGVEAPDSQTMRVELISRGASGQQVRCVWNSSAIFNHA